MDFFFLGGGESAKVNLSFLDLFLICRPCGSYLMFFIVFYPLSDKVHHNTEEKKM